MLLRRDVNSKFGLSVRQILANGCLSFPLIQGICGLFGKATTFVGGDVGSIPACCALEVWQWTFGSRTVWLVNNSAGQPQFPSVAQSSAALLVQCIRRWPTVVTWQVHWQQRLPLRLPEFAPVIAVTVAIVTGVLPRTRKHSV